MNDARLNRADGVHDSGAQSPVGEGGVRSEAGDLDDVET